MPDLKPCECGYPIEKNLRIQQVWTGRRSDVVVVFCSCCERAVPFKREPWEEVAEKAYRVWNNSFKGKG